MAQYLTAARVFRLLTVVDESDALKLARVGRGCWLAEVSSSCEKPRTQGRDMGHPALANPGDGDLARSG
jgi:hypothetical protein